VTDPTRYHFRVYTTDTNLVLSAICTEDAIFAAIKDGGFFEYDQGPHAVSVDQIVAIKRDVVE
jgi:hypothetical protein